MYKALDHMNIEDLIKPDETDFTGKSEAEIHEIQQKHRDEVNDYFVGTNGSTWTVLLICCLVFR